MKSSEIGRLIAKMDEPVIARWKFVRLEGMTRCKPYGEINERRDAGREGDSMPLETVISPRYLLN